MAGDMMKKVLCLISKKRIFLDNAKKGDELEETLFNLIQKEHTRFTKNSYISLNELNKYRRRYLHGMIEQEFGELDKLEYEVVDAVTHSKILSENIEEEIEDELTIGQRLADKIAEFGGSWTFLICFFSFIMFWITINIYALNHHNFDPYPFILLNLILSCLASVQAPIIMMSQNRQEEKDRKRSEYDYKINLKAELEIRLLNEKLDHLLIHQNKRLLEIQKIQADYLEDILKKMKRKN